MVADEGGIIMYPVIDNPEQYKAAIYVRLSKEDEGKVDDVSESIKNQTALLLNYVKENNLSVYEIYTDDGYSGTTTDRPAFQRMLQDIEDKNVNMVITKDFSRLGRDRIAFGYYTEKYFPEHDVRYIAVADNYDNINGCNDQTAAFKSLMNEMHAAETSRKVANVKHAKQKEGLFIGGKAPYGYKKSPTNKNAIVIDEYAAGIVRHIFKLAIEGVSCHKIAMTLTEENIPTPAQYAKIKSKNDSPFSGKWSSERISEMLQNEVYIGNMVQGRVKKASYKSKKLLKLPREQWIVVENTHEAIIDKETFQKAGELIKSRTHTRHRTYDFPLKGIVFCKECGYPLATIKRTLSGGRPMLYFVCRTYQRFTQYHQCTCHCVRVEDVSAAVVSEVRRVCENYLGFLDTEKLTEKAQKQLQAELRKQGRDITALKTKLESIRMKIDSAYEDKLSGDIDNQIFQRIYAKLREEEATARTKLTELENNKKDSPSINEDKIKELVKIFIGSEDYTRELFVSLIERIELSENKELDIHFKFSELKIADCL